MAVVYPGTTDSFNEPTLPETTPLSEAGSATRNHVEHHHDLGQAIVALETNAALKGHDHSGDGTTAHGIRLSQINTHQNADTDSATNALHHTLGPVNLGNPSSPPTGAANKAAPGNHVHGYIVCTHGTRPSSPYLGLLISETDTGQIWVYANTAVITGGRELNLDGSRTAIQTSVTPAWCLVWPLPVTNYVAPQPAPDTQQVQASSVPAIVTLNQNFSQTISPGGTTLQWNLVGQDTAGYTTAGSRGAPTPAYPAGLTAITIPYDGLYTINSNVQWHPGFSPDNANVQVLVNGQPGGVGAAAGLNGGAPGYSQTVPVFGSTYLHAGDQISVKAGYTPTSGIVGLISSFFDQTTSINSNLSVAYLGPTGTGGAGSPGF